MPAAVGDPVLSEDHVRMGCSLRRVAAQSIPDVAGVLISWDTEDEDTHGLWSSGTTVSIPSGGGGIWDITLLVDLAAVVAGRSYATLQIVSSLPTWNGKLLRDGPVVGENLVSVTASLRLAAFDNFTCQMVADTASGTTATAALSAYRVSL